MRTIILFLLLGLSGAFGWIRFLLSHFLKMQSVLLKHMDDAMGTAMRPLSLLLNKEIRGRKKVKPEKEKEPVRKEPERNIVGSTKTVFITELPNQGEPEPVDTIELPLEEPEPPEMMDVPGADDFDYETDLPSESEFRREMEEALFNDGYEDNSPDDYLGGVTVAEIEKAYHAIHNDETANTKNEDAVASVLHSLNGTDMFKFIIDSEESDLKAKSIMDVYTQKYHSGKPAGGKKGFEISNYVE